MAAKKRGRPRRVWYRKLRETMAALNISAEDIGEVLRLSRATVNRKLAGQIGWGVDEAHRVLEYLQIPAEQFYLYFPKNGEDAEEVQRRRVQDYLDETNQALVSTPMLDTLVAVVESMKAHSSTAV